MLPDPRERPLLTVPEAGEALGLGRSAAYEAVRRGDLPSLSIGRRRLVPTARLYALLGLPLTDDLGVLDNATGGPDARPLRAVR